MKFTTTVLIVAICSATAIAADKKLVQPLPAASITFMNPRSFSVTTATFSVTTATNPAAQAMCVSEDPMFPARKDGSCHLEDAPRQTKKRGAK